MAKISEAVVAQTAPSGIFHYSKSAPYYTLFGNMHRQSVTNYTLVALFPSVFWDISLLPDVVQMLWKSTVIIHTFSALNKPVMATVSVLT